MNAREHWTAVQRDVAGIDAADLAAFLNTLHSSGLSAARAFAKRDEKTQLLAALAVNNSLPILAQTREVARRGVLLLRRLQAEGDKQ